MIKSLRYRYTELVTRIHGRRHYNEPNSKINDLPR